MARSPARTHSRRPNRRSRSAGPRSSTHSLALFGAGLGLLVLVGVVTAAVVAVISARNADLDLGEARVTERCEASVGERSGVLDVDQAENAALIATVARQRHLPARAVTIALATAMQESGIRNLDYGDRDSLGMFQQRPSQGWGTEAEVQDPAYAAGKFFDHLVKISGYQDMPITDAAQLVQRSAYPDAYAQHEDMARAFASALAGESPAALTCVLEPAEPGAKPGPLGKAIGAAFRGADATLATDPYGAPVLVVTAAAPGAKGADQAAWALAHWAVVAAKRYGIAEIQVDAKIWERDTGAWADSTRAHPRTGQVVITLSRPAASPTAPSSTPPGTAPSAAKKS